MTPDPRAAALAALLALPDPDDLVRGHKPTLPGDPIKQADLWRTLPIRYVVHRRLEREECR